MGPAVSSNVKGAVLALIAFGLFSTHDVYIKTLGATYSPVQIVFFSVLLSFPLATIMLMGDSGYSLFINYPTPFHH